MVLGALGAHAAAVWLFGSCARGEARQHSDIDIAILPRDDQIDIIGDRALLDLRFELGEKANRQVGA